MVLMESEHSEPVLFGGQNPPDIKRNPKPPKHFGFHNFIAFTLPDVEYSPNSTVRLLFYQIRAKMGDDNDYRTAFAAWPSPIDARCQYNSLVSRAVLPDCRIN